MNQYYKRINIHLIFLNKTDEQLSLNLDFISIYYIEIPISNLIKLYT